MTDLTEAARQAIADGSLKPSARIWSAIRQLEELPFLAKEFHAKEILVKAMMGEK